MRQNMGIIETAMEANKELQKLVEGKIKSIDRMRDLEMESDRKVFRLSSAISSGAISPNVIDDLLVLTHKEDNIVDSMYNLAREELRYGIPDKKTAAMLKQNVLTMLVMVGSALQVMKEMLSSDDVAKIRAFRKEIEVLEQDGDDIKDALLDYEYKTSMDYKTFLHIEEVAHKADDILDSCEDSADMFLSIMLSIMT
jgi:uncharacterized protein Yka (UPF0111/DUF47 family)